MRGRLITGALGGALAAWLLRLIAHAKRPAPEGRWRELDLRERDAP